MGERDDAVEELTGSGVLDAVRWAARSAYRRAFEDHDEDAGYTQGSYGFGATTLLQDRLDRVFSTGRYALGDLDEDAGTDVVALGLDREEVATMPRPPAGTVRRSDLNGSPGWRAGRWRLLLVKTDFGHIDALHWASKSQTRQEVASRPDPDQLALFPEDDQVDAITLMIAHSGDRLSGSRELHLARPRFNRGGGKPWHWRVELDGPAPVAVPADAAPAAPAAAGDVADARVRLRGGTADRAAGGTGPA
jgi:hypothetical protein